MHPGFLYFQEQFFVFSLNSSSCVHNSGDSPRDLPGGSALSCDSCPVPAFSLGTRHPPDQSCRPSLFPGALPLDGCEQLLFGSEPLRRSLFCGSPWNTLPRMSYVSAGKKTKLFCTHTETKCAYCNNQGVLPAHLSCHFPEV